MIGSLVQIYSFRQKQAYMIQQYLDSELQNTLPHKIEISILTKKLQVEKSFLIQRTSKPLIRPNGKYATTTEYLLNQLCYLTTLLK